MDSQPSVARARWRLRSVPPDLVQRYSEHELVDRRRASGRWWPTASRPRGRSVRGAVGGPSLARTPWARWTGRPRSLASSLAGRGVGPGSVVLFQLPNWVEAGITFWGAAYLGAVVVPGRPFLRTEGGRLHPARRPRPTSSSPRTASGTATISPPTTLCSGASGDPLWLVAGETPSTRPSEQGAAVREACSTPTRCANRPRSTRTHRRWSASPRAPPVTRRGSSTRTGPWGSRPASST